MNSISGIVLEPHNKEICWNFGPRLGLAQNGWVGPPAVNHFLRSGYRSFWKWNCSEKHTHPYKSFRYGVSKNGTQWLRIPEHGQRNEQGGVFHARCSKFGNYCWISPVWGMLWSYSRFLCAWKNILNFKFRPMNSEWQQCFCSTDLRGWSAWEFGWKELNSSVPFAIKSIFLRFIGNALFLLRHPWCNKLLREEEEKYEEYFGIVVWQSFVNQTSNE